MLVVEKPVQKPLYFSLCPDTKYNVTLNKWFVMTPK